MSVRYFISTHSMYEGPTGVFRFLLDEPGVPIRFEYLDQTTGQWVEDDALSRHLVNGSDHHDEVSVEHGEAVVESLQRGRPKLKP